MGARCDRKGLQDGVPGKASVQRNYEVPHSEGQIIKRSVIKRSGRYVSKVCYTQGNFRLPERVLFENLPGAKEKRKVASSDKFKAIKPISEKTALQDVNPSRCDSGGRAGRLADFSGSEGCLLPRPGTPFSVEIPEILCGKRHVRVQSLTFRDNDCASCFHQNVGAGGGTYQEGDRSIHISIPGRLLGEGQGKVVLGLQVQGDGPVHVGCRSSDKLGEVGFNPITGHGSYRVEVDDEGGDGFRSGRSDRSNNSNRYDGPEENGSVSRIVPQAARMSKQRHIPGRVGQVVPTADSAISSVILVSQLGNVGGFHSGPEFSQETSGLVAEKKNLERGLPLSPSAPNRELVTDASLEGWGAYLLEGGETRGSWSLQEKSRHINYLEMLAVFNALRYFREMWNAGDIIQVKGDNMTVVTYVNKQGGTKSSTLCFLTWDLLNWCRDRNLKLMAVYVQGEKNVLADLYSRKGLPHEWSLGPAVVEDLF